METSTHHVDDAAHHGPHRVVAALTTRPVTTVTLAGLAATGFHLWWVARNRHLGGFGVDESALLVDAFRIHSTIVESGWSALHGAVMETSRNAPLVPTLSAVSMWVLGRDTTAALAVQPLLVTVTAVAVTGIVARLSSKGAATVAGIVTIGLPVSVMSARYMHLSVGVAAFLCLGMWALLSSDEGRNTLAMAGFGVMIGAMLLSRTMAVSFVPGLILAVAFVVKRERRVAANLTVSVLATAVVAGPWWYRQIHDVGRYLMSFGYGAGSTEINAVPLMLRLPVRAGLTMTDVRPMLLLPAIAVALLTFRARRQGCVIGDSESLRGLGALAAVVVVGFLVLMTSSNLGSWFQMPLEIVAVAGTCAVAGHLALRDRRLLAAAAIVGATANLFLISTWKIGGSTPVGGGPASMVLFGGTELSQDFDFARIDQRFSAGSSAEERRRAEEDWYEAAVRVAHIVEAQRTPGRPFIQSYLGENRLLRAPSIALIEADQGLDPTGIDQPDRPEGMVKRDPFAPPADGTDAVLTIVRTPSHPVDDRGDDPSWPSQALKRGWAIIGRVRTPGGGEVQIYAHPGASGR